MGGAMNGAASFPGSASHIPSVSVRSEWAPATRALALIAVTLLAAGCANTQRSRDVANVRVPPAVTAAQVCSSCHGVDGVSTSPNFPRLAGQSQDYLVSQLQNFRGHHRSDPAGYEYMWGLARDLSDEQITGLAAYFSAQTPRPNRPVPAALLPLGQKIFQQGVPEHETPPCSGCHGTEGQGLAAFPRLAGQHRDYLVKQLTIFQRTEQRPGTPMTQVSHNLTRQEIESVAAYLQTLNAARPAAGN
jgi:cytochrome c553